MVYDIDRNRMILSQTMPPLTRSHLGTILALTYLKREERHIQRYGFSARFVDILLEYSLVSTEKVIALVFEIHSKPEAANLRWHYRVKPPADSGLMLLLGEEKMSVIDISLSGVRFSHIRKPPFKAGEILSLTLVVGRNPLEIDARVLTAWLPSGIGSASGLQHVRAKFLNSYKEFEYLLGKQIFTIDRQLLAKGQQVP